MVNQSVVEIAKKYLNTLPSSLRIKKAYLFGSYAKGQEKEDSDIDIAIILDNMEDFFATQMQLMRLRRKIDLRIEPHPILETDFTNQNPLAYEIQKTGLVLD